MTLEVWGVIEKINYSLTFLKHLIKYCKISWKKKVELYHVKRADIELIKDWLIELSHCWK